MTFKMCPITSGAVQFPVDADARRLTLIEGLPGVTGKARLTRRVVIVVLALLAHEGHAQIVRTSPGTFIERSSQGSAELAAGNQLVEAVRAANAEADRREQARIDAVSASVARDAILRDSQNRAATLELERQMEKTRQETYRHYKTLSDNYYESARQHAVRRPGKSAGTQLEKNKRLQSDGRPECAIRAVMTDAQIATLNMCRD
jgi:hypothetical protein